MDDPSLGWEGVAGSFADLRSDIGLDVVLRWARHLRPGGAVLDIGCGTGVPIGAALNQAGFEIFGIDPSPTLLSVFRRAVPTAAAAEETAQHGRYFDRRFDGIVAVGVMFLMPADDQRLVLARMAQHLLPGGHILFSAPENPCSWIDSLTGRISISLGRSAYSRILTDAGCDAIGWYRDDGGNHYAHAQRPIRSA